MNTYTSAPHIGSESCIVYNNIFIYMLKQETLVYQRLTRKDRSSPCFSNVRKEVVQQIG